MTSPQSVTPLPSVHTPPAQVPGAQLPDQTQFLSWGAKFIEGIVRKVVLAIVGVVFPGSAEAQLNQFFTDLNLPNLASNVTGMLTGVATGVISGFTGLVGGFLNALFGIGGAAIPAYTPSNAAISALQGQVNALLADSDPSTNGAFDGFNTGPSIGSKWSVVCGGGTPVTAEGYIFAASGFECYRYDDLRPGTTLWQVQATMAFKPGADVGASRIVGGTDSTMTSRFPAIEYAPIGAGNMAVRLVSLAGTPNTAANRNLGRQIHTADWVRNVFSFKSGDVLAMECDEDNGIYNIYFNPGPGSVPILSYNDTVPNLIPRGLGHRDGALQLNVNNDPGFPGNGWDNFALFDRATG